MKLMSWVSIAGAILTAAATGCNSAPNRQFGWNPSQAPAGHLNASGTLQLPNGVMQAGANVGTNPHACPTGGCVQTAGHLQPAVHSTGYMNQVTGNPYASGTQRPPALAGQQPPGTMPMSGAMPTSTTSQIAPSGSALPRTEPQYGTSTQLPGAQPPTTAPHSRTITIPPANTSAGEVDPRTTSMDPYSQGTPQIYSTGAPATTVPNVAPPPNFNR